MFDVDDDGRLRRRRLLLQEAQVPARAARARAGARRHGGDGVPAVDAAVGGQPVDLLVERPGRLDHGARARRCCSGRWCRWSSTAGAGASCSGRATRRCPRRTARGVRATRASATSGERACDRRHVASARSTRNARDRERAVRSIRPRSREVRALLGDAPRRRDLLIEHLHRIQDRYGCLAAAHLVALAQEMRLAMAEVHEVATFYHHFDVVDDDDAEAAARSPCASAKRCRAAMAGAQALRESLERPRAARRAHHRRALCRALRAGAGRRRRTQSRSSRRPSTRSRARRASAASSRRRPTAIDYAAYRRDGGYRTLVECVSGARTVDAVIARAGELRRCAVSAVRASRPAASGGSCAPSRRRG